MWVARALNSFLTSNWIAAFPSMGMDVRQENKRHGSNQWQGWCWPQCGSGRERWPAARCSCTSCGCSDGSDGEAGCRWARAETRPGKMRGIRILEGSTVIIIMTVIIWGVFPERLEQCLDLILVILQIKQNIGPVKPNYLQSIIVILLHL